MKITSGVTHPLVGLEPRRSVDTRRTPRTHASQVQPAASRVAREVPPAVPPTTAGRSRRRLGRAGTRALLGVGAIVVLMGCASLPAGPWRVEPMFRLENGNVNAAAGYLALARQYEGENRAADALDAYRKAAQAAPADPDVLNTLGLALAQYAQYGSAVTALRQAVVLAPERAPLLNNLGYALLLDRRTEDARAIFRLTLAVEPTHEMASRNLAYVDQQLAAAAALRTATLVEAAQPAAVPVGDAVVAQAAVQAGSGPTPQGTARVAPEKPAPPSAGKATEPKELPRARTSLDGVSIEIVNGNGITGAAARFRQLLRERGVEVARLANRLPYDSPRTQVLYRPGKADAAQEMAQLMPFDAVIGPADAGSTRADVSVLLGLDIRNGAGCAFQETCTSRPERWASTADLQVRDPGTSIGTRR